MRYFSIYLFLLLGLLSCTHGKNSMLISHGEKIDQNEKALNDFVMWHNNFFSGPQRAITHAELSKFFANNIYFEVNGKKIANNIDEIIHDYDRIKSKGHKRVDIEKFDEKKIEHLNDGAVKITIKHRITMVFKDDRKEAFKVFSEIFIKSGKIYKYVEKFGV